jgi:hypothetical protein
MAAVTSAPPSVPAAAAAVRSALDRVRLSQRGYAAARGRADPLAVTRARTDWGLAVLEWIEASVALAAAEDARDAAGAAGGQRSVAASADANPARAEVEAAWRRYQHIRRNGRPEQVAAARGRWRAALVDWFAVLAQERAEQDQRRAEQDQRRAEPLRSRPALPPAPARPASPPGYRPATPGWTPARRASGS